ncbi:MAG TPA: hypothetical protein VGD08_14940 [Stellaceae bacterium]|jgi:hypothetical protein
MAYLLDWASARERLLGAVLAHRAAARDRETGLIAEGYLIDERVASAARGLGLSPAAAMPASALLPIGLPRVALFCGKAIGYPYYAYYAHCLLSLGLPFAAVDGQAVATGALDGADLLIMPGGFATWGLDRAEDCTGVDLAVQNFIARGGAFIGSCGGAFYVSQGRPGWLGLVDAKPKFTHEYLQTGAGVVNIRLTDPAIRGALPEIIEVPYYHGPAYPPDAGGARQARTLGEFADFAMPSRLFIDNPLDRDRFEQDLRGGPAVVAADSSVGRVLVFSPHPEMGDFVRKGIALDGYVRRYLPIRGEKTMDETLRFYATEDCLSFQLVLNAMISLGLFERKGERQALSTAGEADGGELRAVLHAARDAIAHAADTIQFRVEQEEGSGIASLVGKELARRRTEWAEVEDGFSREIHAGGLDANVVAALVYALNDAVPAARAAGGAPLAQSLVLLELPIRLAAAAARIVRCDRALGELN